MMDEDMNESGESEPIDVLIPVAPKDYPIVVFTVFTVRKYVQRVRDVHLLCRGDDVEYLAELLKPLRVRVTAEESFPYREAIDARLHHFKTRSGWFLQQFLKLCAPLDIPGLSDNVLVVDGDVVFYRATDFLAGGVPKYLSRKFRITPYFEYIERNFGYAPHQTGSAVCHLMLLQRHVLEDMTTHLQQQQGRAAPLWDLLAAGLKDEHLGMSEYETYYSFLNHFDDRYEFEITDTITFADLPRKLFAVVRDESYVAYHDYLK